MTIISIVGPLLNNLPETANFLIVISEQLKSFAALFAEVKILTT
jgi:hypothetical protein